MSKAYLLCKICSMSTRSRSTARAAAKRRAAARRRTREVGKHLFAYLIIAILVLGTISTVIVAQVPVVSTAPTPTPTAGVAPGLQQLITQADQRAAAGNWDDAIGLYLAYLAQDPSNADVLFKLGKAYINKPDPDYLRGLDYIQRALNINPNGAFAAEARALMEQYSDEAAATATASRAITATATITGTSTLTNTNTITATTVVTSTPPAGP